MSERFEPGEIFVYTNGDRWELGEVKRENNSGDGYFCFYSKGDTAANTPASHMHKLANAGWSHIERSEPSSIVRCRDCAGFEDDGYGETICHFAAMVKPHKDDYCSYGERRDA